MTQTLFPPLPLSGWQATRDTIHGYASLTGEIRSAYAPHQKHYWHVSLHCTASGLTTSPIPAGDQTFELLLDFTHHQLLVSTSHGQQRELPLTGQSLHAFKAQTLAILAKMGINPEIDQQLFTETARGTYDKTAVTNFWQALSQIDATLQKFRSGFRGESGAVQLWPHHFDLALLWFSGRLVPDQDPDNPEYADEQMNFGFSTGDEGIPNPYFYVTAYPTPEGWTETELPVGAYWQKEGWTGAVLPYERLVDTPDSRTFLLDFLRLLQSSAAGLMK